MSYNEISIAARADAYSKFAIAPPVYSEIPVAAPPVYAEAPRDDLAAELAQMKAMMEQMRLDKERLETEVKRKAEEDAKRKAEQDTSAAFYKSFIVTEDDMGGRYKHQHQSAIMNSISQRGEVVLLVQSKIDPNCYMHSQYIITNKHMYIVTNYGKHAGPDMCPLYTFDSPIGARYATILEACKRLLSRFVRGSSNIIDLDRAKKFESVIRLIPGSYKNGDWRQLDGFFGMYFNETTMEVSEVPPPSL